MDEVTRLFRVQRTVLEMLRDRGYAVSEESLQETLEEFKTRWTGNRDDLTIAGHDPSDEQNKLFVFFHTSSKINLSDLRELISRAQKRETNKFIIVSEAKPTAAVKKTAHSVFMTRNIRVEFFMERELVVNITKHVLVPQHVPLSPKEKRQVLERYRLEEHQLPRILQADPVARYFGLVPGQVVKIIRPSETAGRHVTFRVCV